MEMQMQIDVWYGVFLMYVGAFLSVLCFARCILYEKIIVSWKRMLGVKFVSCVMLGLSILEPLAVYGLFPFASWIGFMLLTKGRKLRRSMMFWTVLFFIYYLEYLSGILLAIISSQGMYDILMYFPGREISKLLIIAGIFGVGILLQKKSMWKNFIVETPVSFYVISGICELFFYFCVSPAVEVANQIPNKGLQYLIIISYIASAMSLNYFIIALYTSNLAKKRYIRENKLKDELLEMSKEYCNEIVEHEKTARRIRHDMKGHITAMEYLLENGKYDSLKEYLADMGAELSKAQVAASTGYELLDVLLKKYKESGLEKYEVEGRYTHAEIKDYDLCILFSNMISNAAEACRKLTNAEKKVRIVFAQRGDKHIISVKNPIEWDVKVDKLGSYTTKEDKLNHGHGVYRMKEIVERNHGEIYFQTENQMFSVTVIL